jgi:hypothetical protein
MRNPSLLVLYKGLDSTKRILFIDKRERRTLCRKIHSPDVFKRTEKLYRAVCGAVCLKSLEYLCTVVKYGGGRMKRNRTEGDDSGI